MSCFGRSAYQLGTDLAGPLIFHLTVINAREGVLKWWGVIRAYHATAWSNIESAWAIAWFFFVNIVNLSFRYEPNQANYQKKC